MGSCKIDDCQQDRTNNSVQNILALLTVCLDATILFSWTILPTVKRHSHGFSSLCNGCKYGDEDVEQHALATVVPPSVLEETRR